MKYHSRNDSFLLGQPSPIRFSNDTKTTGFYTPTHLEDTPGWERRWLSFQTHLGGPILLASIPTLLFSMLQSDLCAGWLVSFLTAYHMAQCHKSPALAESEIQVNWGDENRTLGASSQRRRQVVVQSCAECRPYWTINGKSHHIYCEKTKFGIAASMTSLTALPV